MEATSAIEEYLVTALKVTLLVIIAAALVIHFFLYRPRPPPNPTLCRTEGCAKFASLVASSLNLSLNPCEDFGYYVCHGLKPDRKLSWKKNLQLAWSEKVAKRLLRGSFTLSATRKAAAMFKSCVNRTGQDVEGSTQQLRSFMLRCRLSWPKEPVSDVEPLDILLDLTINWQLPLWFRIQVLKPTNGGPRRVLLIPLSESLLVLRRYPEHDGSDSYRQEWIRCFNLLSGDSARAPDNARVTKSFKIYNVVSRLIVGFKARPNRHPETLRLGAIETIAPSFKPRNLPAVLNKHLHVSPKLDNNDELIVSDVFFLKNIFTVLTMFNQRDLVDELGWWLVQASGATNFFSSSNETLGHDKLSSPSITQVCLVQVEDVYKLMVASEQAMTEFTQFERRKISTMLESIINHAVSLVRNMNELDKNGKVIISEKLSKITIHIWPEDQYMLDSVLRDLYSKFPEDESTYINYWILARGNASHLSKTNISDQFDRLPHFFYDYPVQYDDVRNRVRISQVALAAPMYYRSGTTSMFFGGLGSVFAYELAEAFDVSNDRMNFTNIRTAALPHEGSGNKGDAFREMVTLMMTHQAFKDVLDLREDLRLELLPGYNEEQIFFITWCYQKCVHDEFGEPSEKCTGAVKNFEPFWDAFHCPGNTGTYSK